MKCIAKVANKVKLSEKTKRQATLIMSNVTKEEISAGKDPMGLARLCSIYLELKMEKSLPNQI